jgi:uncharacterized protein YuzE
VTIRLGHLEFDHVVYDEKADVLYLGVGVGVGVPAEAARQEATPEGHVVRYDTDGSVIGITLVNAKWLVERGGKIDVTVRVDADERAPALT